MVGRVSYLGRVKQGQCHTHVLYTIPKPKTSQTLPFHNNLPYPPPYFGYPDRKSVTLCKYQHYTTLDTYISLSFHIDTLLEYLRYPTLPTIGKIPFPTLSIYPTYPIHVTSAYICTHLTLPFITYPNRHFPFPIPLLGLN